MNEYQADFDHLYEEQLSQLTLWDFCFWLQNLGLIISQKVLSVGIAYIMIADT